MDIPQDPFMLMSFLNLKLRDFYKNLDDLCEDMDLDKVEIENKLKDAGFEYNAENNKFW